MRICISLGGPEVNANRAVYIYFKTEQFKMQKKILWMFPGDS
jgi:hypothetical protein